MTKHKTTTPVRAILISPPQPKSFGAISKRYPVELLPVLGKPFLSRTFELLSELSISHITVFAGTFAAQFEAFIGHGQRWGLTIDIVDMPCVKDALKRLSQHNDPCLMGSTRQLPSLSAESVAVDGGSLNRRFSTDGSPLNWGIINQWPESYDSSIKMFFDNYKFVETELDSPCLYINSPGNFVQAGKDVLSGNRPELLIGGSNAEPGIYISHNVVIHPTVTVTPPVFLGSDVTIGRGVNLGPFAVIETNSIIDEFTTVASSTIMPGTYVGSNLELVQSLVDRNYLVLCDYGEVTPVGDSFLIGPSETNSPFTVLPLFIRLVTLLLAIVSLPLFLVVVLLGICSAKKPIINAANAVHLPAPEDPHLWRTFRYYEFSSEGSVMWRWLMGFWPLRSMPSLFNIICGQLSWVGLVPREAEDITSLPDDWQQLLLTGKNGLIRLADLDKIKTHDDSVEQIYSSEAYYVATHNLRQDLGLLFRALSCWRIAPINSPCHSPKTKG